VARKRWRGQSPRTPPTTMGFYAVLWERVGLQNRLCRVRFPDGMPATVWGSGPPPSSVETRCMSARHTRLLTGRSCGAREFNSRRFL